MVELPTSNPLACETSANILTITANDAVTVIRIAPDGRLFWRGREIETDVDFRAAMLELADKLVGSPAEIERLTRENIALRNLAENLRPGPISEALAAADVLAHAYPYSELHGRYWDLRGGEGVCTVCTPHETSGACALSVSPSALQGTNSNDISTLDETQNALRMRCSTN